MSGLEETEVVISGIGGVLPKSNNIEEFQQLLFNHEEMLKEKTLHPETQTPLGYLNEYDNFDATFFGIHRSMAIYMDRLFRKLLECSFEAIIDAGVSPSALRGRKVVIIVNCIFTDNEGNFAANIERGVGLLNQARAMFSNRISYWLNTVGPSFSIYNNWVSGMSSLEAAYHLIKQGECEAAIVGGFNTISSDLIKSAYKNESLISEDDKTRSFDENATGYTRSDGVIAMFLQRAEDAQRHYASIVDIETIFCGNNSGTLRTMSVDAGRNFLTNFYQRVQIDPSEVEYIEAFGIGLHNQDSFEINVLDQVFNNSSRTEPLLIGSVKSNAGHSEGISVYLAVIKTIMAMEKREIPANLHYEGNKNIPALRDGKIKVVTENTPWSGTLAAVNAYGVVSSCGHILLRSKTQPIQEDILDEQLPHLYIFSTRTEEGIQQIIKKLKAYETLSTDFMNMINNVFSNNITGHLYRGCLIRKQKTIIFDEFTNYSAHRRPVWFVYSGMGSQWVTMGKDLMQIPIFAAAINECHEILKPHGLNLLEIICSDQNSGVFDKILHSFVGIAAIQIGLTDILHALGIKPDNIIGHSVGELGCAYADGCLTAEQMILAAYYRGRASQEVELIPGLMAAVGIGADKVAQYIPPTIDIACRNGPDSCTLSGPAEDMLQLVAKLQASQIFARTVDVAGIAYHSRYIKPAAPLLLNYCKQIIPEPKLRSKKWLSSSVKEANGGWSTKEAQCVSAEYLTNNLLSCVYFEDLLKYIPSNAIVIEIAPHGLLQAILKRSIPPTCDNIALTKRGEVKGTEFLLKNIGKLYLTGTQLNISKLYETDCNNNKSMGPCARGTPSLTPLVYWNYSDAYDNDIIDIATKAEKIYTLSAKEEYFRHLNGHRMYDIGDDTSKEGLITVPITAYMSIVASQKITITGNVAFEDVQLFRHRSIPNKVNTYVPPINIMSQPGTNNFEVNDRYGIVASGRCIILNESEIPPNDTLIKHSIGLKIDELTREDVYREFTNHGLNFQLDFQAIDKLKIYQKGMIANILWTKEWHTFASNMLQMAIFRHGKSLNRSLDTVFIRALVCSLHDENMPAEGSTIEVVYNYITNTISSSIVTIWGPYCEPYKIESNILLADKCYSIVPQKDFEDQKNIDNISVINIKETAVKYYDLNSKLHWVTELKKTLEDIGFKTVYLIMRVIPEQGIDNFLTNVQKLPNGNLIRLIIILDQDAPEFNSITDSFYQPAFKQIESNVSVYSQGIWENRYTISSKLNNNNVDNNNITALISEQDIRRHLPDVNVRFVGITSISMVPTLTNKMSMGHQLGVIDFAGTDNRTNHPVMGLATINNKNHLTADPILRWTMPKHWSLVDGATVPFAYCIAYYAICECAALQAGESILIHNGCSSIGQAMIRIATSLGAVIYTTVGSQRQRPTLLKLLQNEVIFDYTSNKFEQQIMDATRGHGVQVVVNCLPKESLSAGLRCVSPLGRVILLLEENRTEKQYNEFIGLSTFLKCTGMYGIRATKIFNLPEETKKKLHNYILNGLKENHVIPISKQVFRKNGQFQLNNIVKYLTGPTVTGTAVVPIEDLISNKKFSNNPNQLNKEDLTYIVYGSENVDNIATLTKWLAVSYGVKNIIIQSSFSWNINDKKYLERNLTAITEQKSVKIKLIENSTNKPDTEFQQILKQKLNNIVGVLILSDGNNQSDEILINKLQTKFPTTHIVLLSSIANANLLNLERYHSRNIRNVSFLRWDKKLRLYSVLKSLTAALEEVVDIFVRNNKLMKSYNDTDTIFSSQNFCSHLSISVSSLSKLSSIKSSVSIESLLSNTTKHTADLAPLFIIPGLLGSKCCYLQSAVRNFLNPVYILDAIYNNFTLEQLAVRLGEHVLKAYPSGPYNLIGVSTGGPLSIELAKHLETDLGCKVQLYLIDAVPNTIKHLCSSDGDEIDFEVTLLKDLLNIDDSKLAALSTLPNWNARVDTVLKQSCKNIKQVKEILYALKQRIDAAVHYAPSKRTFSGQTHVIVPKESIRDSSQTMEDCREIKIKNIKGNHFTMLQEPLLSEYINENIIHPHFFTI